MLFSVEALPVYIPTSSKGVTFSPHPHPHFLFLNLDISVDTAAIKTRITLISLSFYVSLSLGKIWTQRTLLS